VFTFGIIGTNTNRQFHDKIFKSILDQQIPNVQIIYVGSDLNTDLNVDFIEFDETIKNAWITKKKNLITKFAKNENIVFMHDYIVLESNWFAGFKKFGNDFDVCMNVIKNFDGSRYLDWLLCHEDIKFLGKEYMLPYDENFSNIMYFSGSYYICKKKVCLDFPLNENLCWGEGEDIEFSKRLRQKYKFLMNIYSSVKLLKQKEMPFVSISNTNLEFVKKICQ
jgi:hypothetical protein